MGENEELISWLKARDLPQGHFKISSFETTDNLPNMVDLAIANVRNGNMTARDTLRRLKATMEQADLKNE